jgi:5-methyltetrahydrofolate--homocysteine methyltransferase
MYEGKTMQTLLRSLTSEVKIDTEGPIVMIGEKINPTGRKKLAEALQARNFDYVRELAKQQVAAGADILDINVGVPGLDEVELIAEVVKVVAAEVTVPLCIDSPNPKVMAAGLAVAPGKPLVNSVNGEEKSLQALLPLVKDRGAAVVGLTMDDQGIPATPEERLAIAGRILERAAKMGIPAEDVIIDPLVMSVGADQNAGVITLKTMELIRREFGVNLNLGASNVSFGLPDRPTLNQVFLTLAAGVGASCVITDPVKLGRTIRAVDLLRGRDQYARRYLRYCRQGEKVSGVVST